MPYHLGRFRGMPLRTVRRLVFLLAVVVCGLAAPCIAQTPVTLYADSVFYADNSEFAEAFRAGETILGSFQRVVFDVKAGERASLHVGLFALERAGSPSAPDKALPIVSLRLRSGRQTFVLGTLDTGTRDGHVGPDRTTPHGLLPPLAVETQWFTRAYEAGLQWLTRTGVHSQDVWFDYQAMNTREHREKFDAGAVGQVHVAGPLSLAYQAHLVHHGGQQYWSGPVSDSLGAGPGLVLEAPVAGLESASLELFGLASYDRPDRSVPAATVKGKAVFLRLAGTARGWRGHALAWRGDNFLHEDGDPNYLSRRANGSRFRRIRDYSEAGLTKLFEPAASVDVEASVRVHRVESNYSYSYRILATVHLKLWETTIPAKR